LKTSFIIHLFVFSFFSARSSFFKVCWNDNGFNGLNKGKFKVYQDVLNFKAPNGDISGIKKVGFTLSIMTHFGV
jgi:hypothetical protein